MGTSPNTLAPAERLAAHLLLHPADLVDVRRLQRRFGVDFPATLRVLAEFTERLDDGRRAERS